MTIVAFVAVFFAGFFGGGITFVAFAAWLEATDKIANPVETRKPSANGPILVTTKS